MSSTGAERVTFASGWSLSNWFPHWGFARDLS